MRLTRRTPHPTHGYDLELQTFTLSDLQARDRARGRSTRRGQIMIIPETPSTAVRHPAIISSDQDGERPERVLHDLVTEDRWIRDFLERLKIAIDEIVRKK
jgi:hypothetical protein